MINLKATILIVDDMQVNLAILSEILKDEYHIKIAKSGKKALEIVENGNIDLILLDVVMPELDGYEVCEILKQNDKTKDIPIIFVTANKETDDEEKGFQKGAVDYITKPFKPKTILARVKTHINLHLRQIELETLSHSLENKNLELKEYISIIEEISITDGLTNVYNRRHFNDIFPKLINSAKRNDELVCFLLLDIDHFKLYNDNYGHQMGDDVLIKFANALKHSLKRGNDMCFRLGGEEFGVIFKAENKEKALELANILRTDIENLAIPHEYSSTSKYITTSLGLICKYGRDIENVDKLYKEVDDLLYKAKESGRNKIIVNEK